MKPKQKTSSTQVQIFESPHQQAIPVDTFEDYGFAYFYEQKDGSFLTAIPPNPPTPEAVAKAQFVDKTYVWQGK